MGDGPSAQSFGHPVFALNSNSMSDEHLKNRRARRKSSRVISKLIGNSSLVEPRTLDSEKRPEGASCWICGKPNR